MRCCGFGSFGRARVVGVREIGLPSWGTAHGVLVMEVGVGRVAVRIDCRARQAL